MPTNSTATRINQALLRPAPDVVWQETLAAVAELSNT
ncbi:MAG: hypothetical protein JWO11_196 [Nocardioides sp.]|nr:hypothetical protein [Nocardioides sp.]